MSPRSIDLNCDLGEREDAAGAAADLELLTLVSSANIACGGHAGDERSMERLVRAALELGVAPGAHPGYPDRANFGRVARVMDCAELEDTVAAQVAALSRIVVRGGGRLTHVKPHGALYHAAMGQWEVAEAVGRGVQRVAAPVMVGLAGAAALGVWQAMGLRVAGEAFAARRYERDGTLTPRSAAGALLDDPDAAAAQAVRIATGIGVQASGGTIVPVRADTICLHSDTPTAVLIAQRVREALLDAGFLVSAAEVAPPGS